MGEDAEDEFAGLGGVAAGGQGRAEAALVLAEPALRMPALIVGGLREAVSHRAPIGRLGPAATGVAAVEGDERLPNVEVFATEAVIVLRIVARIAGGRCRSE